MPNTRHSPWRRPGRHTWGLASSTSEPAARGFFRCQNSPSEDRCDDGWLALFGWPEAQKVGPGSETPHPLLYSLFGLIASILEPRNRFPAVPAARALCYQCWPNKVSHWLARFRASFRTGGAVGERKFRRWGRDIGAIGWRKWIDLIGWHLLVRTANNEEFECSQSKAFLLHPRFSEENKIVRLQLHLPFLDNNQSENDI